MRRRVAAAFLAGRTACGLDCEPQERLDGRQCYGLEQDAAASEGARACARACCVDEGCEVWQFHRDFGCFRGRAEECLQVPGAFARGSVGARLRGAPSPGNRAFAPIGSGLAEMMWAGTRADFNTLAAIEPYAHGPEERRYTGTNGEIYLLRRRGAGPENLDVSVSCWSIVQQPSSCCGPGAQSCWPFPEFREHCCSRGMGQTPEAGFVLYSVFVTLSAFFDARLKSAWDGTFPGFRIDEAAFAEKRAHWRLGLHESGLCAAAGGQAGEAVGSEGALRALVRLFLDAGTRLSRSFLNLGAGTCAPPDPLHELAFSEEGRGFTGLAVDANAADLERCSLAMRNASAKVQPLLMALDPASAKVQLRPHLAPILAPGGEAPPWPLDILVIDIDGCDCLVVESLLGLVQPKVLMVEMTYHFPPPFRFSAQHHAARAGAVLGAYDVTRLNPAAGCSLSYALAKFARFGYYLLSLTHMDAIFVHESVAPVLQEVLGVQFPQDEFLCYRQSHLWMQMPLDYVREWFFAPHPAESLGRIWENVTALQREAGGPPLPFVLDY